MSAVSTTVRCNAEDAEEKQKRAMRSEGISDRVSVTDFQVCIQETCEVRKGLHPKGEGAGRGASGPRAWPPPPAQGGAGGLPGGRISRTLGVPRAGMSGPVPGFSPRRRERFPAGHYLENLRSSEI